jgi:hypothetical protein
LLTMAGHIGGQCCHLTNIVEQVLPVHQAYH